MRTRTRTRTRMMADSTGCRNPESSTAGVHGLASSPKDRRTRRNCTTRSGALFRCWTTQSPSAPPETLSQEKQSLPRQVPSSSGCWSPMSHRHESTKICLLPKARAGSDLCMGPLDDAKTVLEETLCLAFQIRMRRQKQRKQENWWR